MQAQTARVVALQAEVQSVRAQLMQVGQPSAARLRIGPPTQYVHRWLPSLQPDSRRRRRPPAKFLDLTYHLRHPRLWSPRLGSRPSEVLTTKTKGPAAAQILLSS